MPASYLSRPVLTINGADAPSNLIDDILQIAVEESLSVPSMFTLIINNPYLSGREKEEPKWQHQKLFKMGTVITIGFSSATTDEFPEQQEKVIIKGEITGMEAHFTSGSQAVMIIRGYDVGHRLHRGRYNRSFQNMTDSDIVQTVITEVGIQPGSIDSIPVVHEYIFQENQTNMEFLRERAKRNGFEVFIQDDRLNFRKPKSNQEITLEWLKNLFSFRVRISSAEQVPEVEVRGWDYEKKQAIIGTANTQGTPVITTTTSGKGKDSSTVYGVTPKYTVIDRPIYTQKEAQNIAQAIFDELSGQFVHADGKAEGNPEIRVGSTIKLSNMGNYDGIYYVTDTRHLYHERLYTTEFSVRGTRGGDILQTLTPSQHLEPGQTLLVGIVTDNNDPKQLSRVKVKFPCLTEEHTSYWARVVSFGAGNSRGNDWLPEINDEVLVAFEHGDIHRPFVLGNVWNGQDKPPTAVGESVVGGKVRLRTFQTRTGHQLQFVEEDKGTSKAGFLIKTTNGHRISCNDSDKIIEIKTIEGHQTQLDDQNKKIEITTTGGLKMTMNDSSKEVVIQSGSATITLKQTSGEINIKAGTKLTIDAQMIEINSGGMMKLNSSGIMTIKGSLINLN